jgi:hypothetical protein
VRTVKTASGATAVQVVYSSRRGSRDIEHLGSAHDDVELTALKAVARERMARGQQEIDLGLPDGVRPGQRGPLPITSSRMAHLWDALAHAYRVLGFEQAMGGEEVFRQLLLARIVELASKLDSLRVFEEIGVSPPSYAKGKRRLPLSRSNRGAGNCPRRVRRAPGRGRGRPAWRCTTSRRCTSRPMPATGSVNRASPRSGASSRRSPSACSPTLLGSR